MTCPLLALSLHRYSPLELLYSSNFAATILFLSFEAILHLHPDATGQLGRSAIRPAWAVAPSLQRSASAAVVLDVIKRLPTSDNRAPTSFPLIP